MVEICEKMLLIVLRVEFLCEEIEECIEKIEWDYEEKLRIVASAVAAVP